MPLNIRQHIRRVWIPPTKPERPGQFSISLNWISWPFVYGCVSRVGGGGCLGCRIVVLRPLKRSGGGGGIRTPGGLASTSDFKSGALNHSATPPEVGYNFARCPGLSSFLHGRRTADATGGCADRRFSRGRTQCATVKSTGVLLPLFRRKGRAICEFAPTAIFSTLKVAKSLKFQPQLYIQICDYAL